MKPDETYFCYETPYVQVLAEHELTALLYCISQIVDDWWDDLELYMRGTIGKEPDNPAGGDPGWILAPPDEKSDLFYAWVHVDLIYDDEHNEGDYDEATVKYHMRRAFDKMWELRPERRAEVEAIIQKYAL
jgi:hypothetical protein